MTEIAERTPMNALVSRVRSNEFRNQIAVALPGNVTPDRFVRALVTALMQNPDIQGANPDSVFMSAMRCAQDGLLPDGKEAALVLLGGKAVYFPMIAGFRKIAAEHGWQLATNVVYENDTFDYELGLSPTVTHKPARLGTDRGKAIGAYAVATHKDGRKQIEVLTAEEIEKVRASSRSRNSGPWTQWTDRMWEKTSGRRLFAKLPLSEADRERIERVLAADEYDDPIEALYGPQATPLAPPAPVEVPSFDEETGEVLEGEYENGDDPAVAMSELAIAAEQGLAAAVPSGTHKGKSLKEMLDARPATDSWWVKALQHDWKGHEFGAAVYAVVRAHAPDLIGEAS